MKTGDFELEGTAVFLKMWQRFAADLSGYELRPVVVALKAIDRVDDASGPAGPAVQIGLDGGDSIVCVGTIDQVCDAIETLTEDQGLVVIDEAKDQEACEPDDSETE
jgi:hypothetical protein